MAHPAAVFLDHLLDQIGDEVKFGTEVAHDATDSAKWDSGELVEWAAKQAGVTIADGSWRQYRELHNDGNAMEVATALQTPGALLFKFSSDADPLTGMPSQRQVMISLGNGKVIDASGKQVRVAAADAGDFTHAALVTEFAIDQTADADVRVLLEQRLEQIGVDTAPPVAPDPAAPAPEPSPPAADPKTAAPTGAAAPATTDAVALRKEARDLSQKAEELRRSADQGEQHQRRLEEEAHRLNDDMQRTTDDAAREFKAGNAAKAEAAQLEGAAAEAKLREAEQHLAKSKELQREAEALGARANSVDEQAGRARDTIVEVRAEAETWQAKAVDAFNRSTAAIDARMPEVDLDGNSILEPVPIIEIPPPPPAGADEAAIRKWVQQREAAEESREMAAQQRMKDAAGLDDLAEVKRDFAADAQARAASALANAASEQARADELRGRLSTADAHAQRLSDEMAEEQAQLERLTAQGDKEGAALADSRVDSLLSQHISWSGQASRLRERLQTAEATVTVEQENAKEFGDIATALQEEAQRAGVLADQREAEAAALQKQADQLDVATDAVEDALGRDIRTKVIIAGEEDLTVEVPGRDPSTLTPDEQQDLRDGLPGSEQPAPAADPPAAPAAADAPAPAAVIDDPTLSVAAAEDSAPEPTFEDAVESIDASVDALVLDDLPADAPATDFGDDFTV